MEEGQPAGRGDESDLLFTQQQADSPSLREDYKRKPKVHIVYKATLISPLTINVDPFTPPFKVHHETIGAFVKRKAWRGLFQACV